MAMNYKELAEEAKNISETLVSRIESFGPEVDELSELYDRLEEAMSEFGNKAEEVSSMRDDLCENVRNYVTFIEEHSDKEVSKDVTAFIDSVPTEEWWAGEDVNSAEGFKDSFCHTEWEDVDELDWGISIEAPSLGAEELIPMILAVKCALNCVLEVATTLEQYEGTSDPVDRVIEAIAFVPATLASVDTLDVLSAVQNESSDNNPEEEVGVEEVDQEEVLINEIEERQKALNEMRRES